MQIDDTLLAKLEKLSHVHIAQDKKEEVKGQLSDILAYVENLSELDTSTLDSRFSTLEGGTPLRADTPTSDTSLPQDVLKHAPNSSDDFFIVPAIIE